MSALLIHLNSITRNQDIFAGGFQISVTVIVKHVQHIRLARAFFPPNLHPPLSKVSCPPHQVAIFM